jgi:hypothetical protein
MCVCGGVSAWVRVCARVSVHGCGATISFCRSCSICLLVAVVDVVYVIPLALVDELCILISANLHDANVIDVVNAPFVWVCD